MLRMLAVRSAERRLRGLYGRDLGNEALGDAIASPELTGQ